MTDAQLYILVAIPMFGILSNIGIAIYLGGRIDKVVDNLGAVGERLTRVEGQVSNLDGRVKALEGRITSGLITK